MVETRKPSNMRQSGVGSRLILCESLLHSATNGTLMIKSRVSCYSCYSCLSMRCLQQRMWTVKTWSRRTRRPVRSMAPVLCHMSLSSCRYGQMLQMIVLYIRECWHPLKMKHTLSLLLDNFYLLISVQMFGSVSHVLNHYVSMCESLCSHNIDGKKEEKINRERKGIWRGKIK